MSSENPIVKGSRSSTSPETGRCTCARNEDGSLMFSTHVSEYCSFAIAEELRAEMARNKARRYW